ncbi:MAG: DGQHR domain-containing protein [Acidobacteria bacterium]|nr:DGQHR domain-containing protein [Acidobacteriota bacterium]
MTDIDYSADTNLALEVVQQENRKRRALSVLLGDLRTKAEHHLAIQVQMGEVDSYITSVPLRWIAAKVGFAADLPLFRESIEGSKRIAADQDTIETVQQRHPDWRRQQELTAYLATRRHHKFPPLLLVAYQHWVYEGDSDKWAPDGTAMNDSLTLASLEPTGTYWDLDDSETLLYAFDGQHRLMAIQGFNGNGPPDSDVGRVTGDHGVSH